jgi:hypothetical protein
MNKAMVSFGPLPLTAPFAKSFALLPQLHDTYHRVTIHPAAAHRQQTTRAAEARRRSLILIGKLEIVLRVPQVYVAVRTVGENSACLTGEVELHDPDISILVCIL